MITFFGTMLTQQTDGTPLVVQGIMHVKEESVPNLKSGDTIEFTEGCE